jgi:hypothetical protein
MFTHDDRVIDDERGFRTPAFNLGQLVVFETYGEGEGECLGRVVGLLIAGSERYHRLTERADIFPWDVWGYEVLDVVGGRWQRTAHELTPLGLSGE